MDNTPRLLAGRYEVGETIGRGGMAEVHIGRDTRLGRTVAIKMLRTDLARDPSFQARFRREAQAAAGLNHPAIVAVYDTGEEITLDTTGQELRLPFIVMEYVEGHTVRELIRDGAALPIDEAVEITIGVLSALQYSHHAGIVHRDVKPANVMITTTGAVKVMDFGIARALADSAATMTQTQAVIGTAQYLSPEQARGEPVDTRSDLYSTGCLLFELLTGRTPFVGDSAVAVAYQHVREEPLPPSAYAPDVPEVLDRIVLKALMKDRDMRYSTAAEFRADLESAARGGMVSAPPIANIATAETQVMNPTAATQVLGADNTGGWAAIAPPPLEDQAEEEETPAKKNWWLIGGLIALGLVAIGAIVVLLVNNASSPPPTPTATETTPQTVTIPPVTAGMTPEQAEQALTDLGLVPAKKSEYSGTIEKGLVIRFEPATNETVLPGSTVTYFVSSGQQTTTVPSLVGKTEEAARQALKDAGLKAGEVTSVDTPSFDAGVVATQDQQEGATVKRGTTVNFQVASGNVQVPDVVGKNQDKATQELEVVGLVVGEFNTQPDESKTNGYVLAQDLKAGEAVKKGTTITLTVVLNAEKKTVPYTAGSLESDAKNKLVAEGFVVGTTSEEYSDTRDKGQVIRSDPDEGSQVEAGSTVNLVISLGPEPVPTTDEPQVGDTGGDGGDNGGNAGGGDDQGGQ